MDGQSLTVAGVVGAARYGASVALDQSPENRERMAKSRDVLVDKVQANKSVYGVSTGLGGSGACHVLISCVCVTQTKHHITTFPSVPKPVVLPRATADTRTNHTIGLGHALIQHHHTGVLPSLVPFQDSLPALPLSDPLASMSMPEAWVRGAILVRINSLIRGHSAVRWELLEKMVTLLHEDITPCVPLRGSISASGGTSV